jgi:hypothetical protein
MPSLQDVADQINAKLDSINSNTQLTAVNTAETLEVAKEIRDLSQQANGTLTAIRDELEEGFANLSQGLFALVELERASLHLLDHHRRQHDTIICELVNANDTLCGMTRKLTTQLTLSEFALVALRRLDGIAGRVHADAAGGYDRDRSLRDQIEACCPPTEPEPEPCPPSCDRPTFEPRPPEGQDWKPLPPARDPIG